MDKMKENIIYCANWNIEMKEVFLSKYEYVKGFPLKDVKAYKCDKCDEIYFSEEQAKILKAKTRDLKESVFGFIRKVTISGRSLVISIPKELAEHMKIKQGEKVKVMPIEKEGFMVSKI